MELSYRLVWEANDEDERGWYTVGSGMEYSFVVTPEIMRDNYPNSYADVVVDNF